MTASPTTIRRRDLTERASPTREDASLQLPAIDCSIPLRAIYEGVELAPAPLHDP